MVNSQELEKEEHADTSDEGSSIVEAALGMPVEPKDLEDFNEEIDLIMRPILVSELGEDFSNEPYSPPVVEIKDDAFHILSRDPLESTVLRLSDMAIENGGADIAINFLAWALKKYRPQSFLFMKAIVEIANPYVVDNQERKEANMNWFTFLDNLISRLNDHPELRDQYRINRVHHIFKMLNQGVIKIIEEQKEKHYQFYQNELEELKQCSVVSDEVKKLLQEAELIFDLETKNHKRIIENIDRYIEHIKTLEDVAERYYFTRLINPIYEWDISADEKKDTIRSLFDALVPDRKNFDIHPDLGILANMCEEHDLSISIFEGLSKEMITRPPCSIYYMNSLYASKEYEKIIAIAPEIYDHLNDDWKQELIHISKIVSIATSDVSLFDTLSEKYEKEQEEKLAFPEEVKTLLYNHLSPDNKTGKTVVGLTIDLKYSDNHGVQICELNALPRSGLDGYKAAYHADLREDIGVFYRNEVGIMPTPEVKRYNGSILYKHHFYQAMATEQVTGFSTKNNSSPSFAARVDFKDVTMMDSQEIDHGGVFPQGVVLCKQGFEKELKAFIKTLSSSDLVVLKPTNDCVGEGVTVLSKKDILKTCDRLFNKKKFSDGENAWVRDIHPNFVIQKCAKSDPVTARDGKEYDGTMRFVVSIVHDHTTGYSALVPHGAYWKLPPRALSEVTSPQDLQKTIISQPPSKLGGKEKDRPFSEVVDLLSRQKYFNS